MAFLLAFFIASPAFGRCQTQQLGGAAPWARNDRLFAGWQNGTNDGFTGWSWKKTANIGDGRPISLTYTVTHQGNGTLEIANLNLRIWRIHESEGFTYSPPALRVDLVARPKSSYCDLVVSGHINLLGSEDRKAGHSDAKLVYRYDAATRRFHRVSGTAPIPLTDIDLTD